MDIERGTTLNIEQQFAIAAFSQQIEGISRDQAVDMLIELYTQYIRQGAIYRKMLEEKWGINSH